MDISNQSSDSPRRPSTFCARYLLVLKYWKYLYIIFRALSTRMSDATLRVCPLDIQQDIELTHTLKGFISFSLFPLTAPTPMSLLTCPIPFRLAKHIGASSMLFIMPDIPLGLIQRLQTL